MINKLEEIKPNSGINQSEKPENRLDMRRVVAMEKAIVGLYDALKEHASSLTEADMDRIIMRMGQDFEEYLDILLEKRQAAFNRRKERIKS